MITPSPKVTIGAVAILLGTVVVIVLADLGTHPKPALNTEIKLISPSPPPPPVVHTAAWYVAHPNALRADEQRCAGDAAALPQAACQNAAAADAQLSATDYAQAAAALNNPSISKPSIPKTP